jgi:clan AA aspartic protease
MVPLLLRGTSQADITVQFVLDTGFTGALCLPATMVRALGLPFPYDIQARLADGSQIPLPVHAATALWDGAKRDVAVLATGREPLLGTALLDGCELLAQFKDAGLVTIDGL